MTAARRELWGQAPLGTAEPVPADPLRSLAGRGAARHLFRCARPPRLRGLLEFARQTIIIPDGPCMGRPFDPQLQPFAGLILREIEARPGRWRRILLIGCTQSGKTLILLIALLYYLFERREKVIFGVTDMLLAGDKWREHLLPILTAAGLQRYLPRHGGGSRGGTTPDSVAFRHHGTLRFMSGGGGDAQRSSYTASCLVITEYDKLDAVTGGGPETDKIRQMRARLGAYGGAGFELDETTPTTSRGRAWREYGRETGTVLACPCPHCGAYVTPERQHLVGWQAAGDIVQAQQMAHWVCPGCSARLSEAQRGDMNRAAVLLHRGQRVAGRDADGRPVIAGDEPATSTLTVRWNAFNNLFWNAGYLGEREWAAANDPDPRAATPERDLLQFVWAQPWDPPEIDLSGLDALQVAQRSNGMARGVVSAAATGLVVALDLGKRLCHWLAVAALPGRSAHVVDYGVIEVHSGELDEETALLTACREFGDLCAAGWAGAAVAAGQHVAPALAVIDSGWWPSVVYQFARERGGDGATTYVAAKGYGAGAAGGARRYRQRSKQDRNVKYIGERCALVWQPQPEARTLLLEVDADHWKTIAQRRLAAPPTEEGALTLFAAEWRAHLPLAKQLVAERKVEDRGADGQAVVRWENTLRRANHWFDCLYMALAAARLLADGLGRTGGAAPQRAGGPATKEQTARRSGPSGWRIGR